MYISFSQEEAHEAGMLEIMDKMRTALRPHQVLVARNNIFRNGSALLAELSCSDAAFTIADLFEEAAHISPTTITLKTGASVQVWESSLERIWHDNPSLSCHYVKWRQSCLGGRTWSQAPSTKTNMSAVKVKDREPPGDGKRETLQIGLNGRTKGEAEEALIRIMSALHNQGVQLRYKENHEGGGKDTWHIPPVTPLTQLAKGPFCR